MKTFATLFFVWGISISVCNSQSWIKADNLRITFLDQCNYDSALYYAEEVAAIQRGSNGEKTVEFADALNKLAVSHFYLGNLSKAKYYTLKEIELREVLKVTGNSKYIQALINASIICRRSGCYDEALVFVEKAERKALKILGSENTEYAYTLSCHAGVYIDMGSASNDMVFLNKAKSYFLKAEAILKKNTREAQRAYIVNKSNEAAYYNNCGYSPMAELLFLEVISLCLDEYGDSSPFYAAALNNLGVFYYNQGLYKQAEKHFIKALEIYKKSTASGSIQSGNCINNLGSLYYEIGNYTIAEKLLLESRGILDNGFQKTSPYYSVALNNQAAVLLAKEYYASSENKNRGKLLVCGNILLAADSIHQLNCKAPQPDGINIKNNIALWYKLTGDSKKSLQIMTDQAAQSSLSLKPISMINKMGIPTLIPVNQNGDAKSILEPVMISIRMKQTDHMVDEQGLKENTLNQSASTRLIINMIIGKAEKVKRVLGPYHPGYAGLIKSLIPLYKSIGSGNIEEELTLNYINILNHNILQDFSFLSDSEKEMYFQTRLPDINAFIAYTLARKETNPAIAGNAYDFVLQNKGLMLKSSTAMRLAILNSGDTVLLKKYDQWLSYQREISTLYATPVEMRTQDVSDLEGKANLLEKALVQSSQEFSDLRKGMQVTWEDVRDNLKPDEAAIEFTDFRFKGRDLGDVVVYCAMILRPNSQYPEMIRLFEEKDLLDVIGTSGETDINYINNLYGTGNRPDDRLYRLIWQPLEEYLSGVKKVILSPSGLLLKVSFPAISNGRNVYLCDNFRIQVKGSTGAVDYQDVISTANNLSALVFGGIKYSSDNSGSQVWAYLQGSKDEGEAVRGILEKELVEVQYLTDMRATETYLKLHVSDYNVLHVATHGFFFPDPNEIRFEEKDQQTEFGLVEFRGGMRGFGVNSFVNNQNPFMRSGLVFAGANDVWNNSEMDNEDDGVLTAQEVTQIDMRKNNLVVLSACETGLGDIKDSEGVYGLQRAFKMAGVKYLIMSLWQVPDKETVEFMETFYTKLLQEKEIRKAFTDTQNEMRQKYDPYFWAAFGLIE